MKKTLLTLALSTLTLGGISTTTWAATDQCGNITIADMNWASASFLANVDKIILEEGYQCDVTMIPGDTVPTSTSMIEKGQPDIAPEMWTNSIKEPLEKAVQQGKLVKAGRSLSDGGEEGFWVPDYLVKQYPELTTIAGIKKHAALFEHPEDPEKSMFMGCPAGWACQASSENLFRALQLESAGFKIVDPGSGAGLAGSIAKAYERKTPWFGYYWAPTPVLGRYPMVRVDFGSGVDEEHFRNCLTQPDCENPKVSMHPRGPVWTLTTTALKQKSPQAYQYLSKRSIGNKQMNTLLAWIDENQADGEFAAFHFLSNYPDIWQQWVPADVAKRINKVL
mgnify:CR=1 FL=1